MVLVSASGEEMVRPIGDAARHHRRDRDPDGRRRRPLHRRDRVLRRRQRQGRRGHRDWPRSAATTWPTAYAYSDSISDVPLLECVGHPSAVNPTARAAPAGRRARLAGARVPPPDPARPPAARTPGRPGRRGRARRRGRRRHRHRLVRPSPPHPHRPRRGTRRIERPGQRRFRSSGHRRRKGRCGPHDQTGSVHGHRAPTRDQPRQARRGGSPSQRRPPLTTTRCTLGNPAGRE